MKRTFFISLAGLALVLLIALLFWRTAPGPPKPLAAAALGDGRILQVEAVTYGTNHQVGNRSSTFVWRFKSWMPGRLYERLVPERPESRINSGSDGPALVVWVNAVSEKAGTNVDCQGIRVELVNDRGEHFESARSWFGGDKFWRVGHIFRVYPRNEEKFTLLVTTWKSNLTSRLEFANPHVVRAASWTGVALPQQKPVNDLSVVLAGLRLRTNGTPPKYWTTQLAYWEPVWELRHGQATMEGWTAPEWFAEDPLGNRGKYLGTNQPVLRFSATFYPAATNAAATQLLATLPPTTVTNLQSPVWWNQTARHESGTITILGLFPAGNQVFEDGVLLTNPPVTMRAVSGGAPSGWTGQSVPVNPVKVVQYHGHYSTKDGVIYVSAPNLGGTERLAMRLRDEQGRSWEALPEPQGSSDGIYPFLVALPPDVGRVTPELLLLKPVTAEFMVKVP